MKSKRTIKGGSWVLAVLLLLVGCTNEITAPGARSDGKARVNFDIPGIAQEVTPRAVLAENTTVRVVAYRAGETTYCGSQAYYTDADGKLKPCTVNDDGSFKAVDTQNELALLPDAYDFYAYTPALPLSADYKSVTVPNGVDYASSVKTGVSVTTDMTLTLTELARKCSKIALVVKKADDNTAMTTLSVASSEVTISALAASQSIALNKDITPAAGTATLNVPSTAFTLAGTTSTAITYLLPRPGTDRMKVDYNLTYTVSGTTETKPVSGTMGNIVLEKGKSYTFTLTMRKTGASLSVTDWIENSQEVVTGESLDYTDNGKSWFLIAARDAKNPVDGTATMNWYVATGTPDATYNPNGKYKACPDGWRVPNMQELILMWVYGFKSSSLTTIENVFWTSTDFSTLNASEWVANLFDGGVTTYGKTSLISTRCIRNTSSRAYPYVGNNSANNAKVIVSRENTGGTSEDRIHALWSGATPSHNEQDKTYNLVPAKLEIAKEDCNSTNSIGVNQTNGKYTWNNAVLACAAYSENGATVGSWRLPTQRELQLTMAVYLSKGITGITSFLASTSYWSATLKSNANEAWRVGSNGYSVNFDKTLEIPVRCVRDVSPAEQLPIIVGMFGGWDMTSQEYTKLLEVESVKTADDPTKAWAVPAAENTTTSATAPEYGVTNVATLSALNYGLANYPAAKYCADKGGSWYLPSQNQLMAIWIAHNGIPAEFSFKSGNYWSATEDNSNNSWSLFFGSGPTHINTKVSSNIGIRCVKDVAPKGTKFSQVVISGNKVILDNRSMLSGAITTSKKPKDITGGISSSETNKTVSHYFEVAKTDVNSNSVAWASAVPNCESWNEDGGGWRLPTQRELQLIWTMSKSIEKKKPTGFTMLNASGYWSATEKDNSNWWYVNFLNGNTLYTSTEGTFKVRCIRDVQ